jgi:TPR repeat protein
VVLLGIFGGAAPASRFVEREPWERGFAETFAREIAPRLARLERQRRRWVLLWLSLVCGILSFNSASVVLIATGREVLGKALLFLMAAPLTMAAILPYLLIVKRVNRSESRVFLPAVCRHLGGVSVAIAPRRAQPGSLHPYWDLGVIEKPARLKVEVQELFTGERGGVGLTLASVLMRDWKGRSRDLFFHGGLVELRLPAPGMQRDYRRWSFSTAELHGTITGTEPGDLRTPQVAEALADLALAFASPQMRGAVSGRRLYVALPTLPGHLRRFRLWTPVGRSEPAIRMALAQLAAALGLAEAVAAACPAAVPSAEPAAIRFRTTRGTARRAILVASIALVLMATGLPLGWMVASAWWNHRISALVDAVRAAAEAGDPGDQLVLGRLYETGRGVEHNDAKALLWYRRAADHGDADAEDAVGRLYRSGQGVARDYPAAMAWFGKAARHGDAAGERDLGDLYLHGLGVTADYGEALRWLRLAAAQGNAAALDEIADIYEGGLGVAKDAAAALHWRRAAADRGFAPAQSRIAVLYATGEAVPRDRGEAEKWRRWIEQAAAAGDANARRWLAKRP